MGDVEDMKEQMSISDAKATIDPLNHQMKKIAKQMYEIATQKMATLIDNIALDETNAEFNYTFDFEKTCRATVFQP